MALARMAAAAPKEDIKAIVEREYPSLEKIYMGVHQAPELSLMEEKTAGFLAGELRKAGYSVSAAGTDKFQVTAHGAQLTLVQQFQDACGAAHGRVTRVAAGREGVRGRRGTQVQARHRLARGGRQLAHDPIHGGLFRFGNRPCPHGPQCEFGGIEVRVSVDTQGNQQAEHQRGSAEKRTDQHDQPAHPAEQQCCLQPVEMPMHVLRLRMSAIHR